MYIRLVKTEAWRDHFARALEATSGRAAKEDAADAFMPHLSLAYGLTRANDREGVRKEAEMMVANENFDGEEMEFETISLWETDVNDDSCASWRCVTREKLKA